MTPGPLDLPLFNDGPDDAPLVSVPAVPRLPLAVRRSAPATPRRFDEALGGEPGFEFPDASASMPASFGLSTGTEDLASPSAEPAGVEAGNPASPGRRFAAAAIDAAIIGGIDATVVYFTLQLCGLRLDEIRTLPAVPLLSFLIMLNGGYLTIFTAAGGQTIGKMLAGVRVVPAFAEASARVPFGTAALRAALTLVSLIPAGAGFFMAFVRSDGRALHDTIAGTRVVEASSDTPA